MKQTFLSSPLLAGAQSLAQPALAQIQTAKVTGGEVQGVAENEVVAFKGIPFAAPPVGELRWKAPQPVKGWAGVKKADAFAPACFQDESIAKMIGASTNFSEDCLYLNVWTPAKAADAKLPVMVWIYGGGFVFGSTDTPMYDGARLAQKGVVLVSVAYRVGAFGFLAHPDLSKESGKGSGAYGIQDQIAGLRWVKDNIASFGGDPARVTLFGESAGGVSVSMLAASPAATGLFHRAISQSGGSFAPTKLGEEGGQSVPRLKLAESQGEKLLAGLGVSDIKAARGLSAEQIYKATDLVTARFWPVADGEVILGDQYELYQAGRFNDTPVLIGTNSDDGAMFTPPGTKPEAFEQQIRAGYGEMADVILGAYPHAVVPEAFKSAKEVVRDSAYGWPTWTWARLHVQKSKNKAFVYYFDHRPPGSPDGADHASEIVFVFRNLGGFGVPPTPEEVALSDLISSYWVNFATSGDPNDKGLPTWPAFNESAQTAMFFDAKPSARPLPNVEKLKAFDAYFAWRREQFKKAQ